MIVRTSYLVFLISAAGVLYVLIIYPLLIAAWAKFRPRPVAKAWRAWKVSVIIPVRNGERWLNRKLLSVLGQDYPSELVEVIVVSDGSVDGTELIARSFASRGVKLLTQPPRGKPAALNTGLREATGELVLLTDVRQVLKPDCLSQLVQNMADPQVGVVSGNLVIESGQRVEEQSTGLYWRYENWIRRNLSRIDSMLGATGPIYLIRRSLAVPIPEDQLLDDVYLPMTVLLRGYRLVLEEKAIAIDEPTEIHSEFKRKLRTQAGVLQLIWTFPSLFTPISRVWFHFLSLKLGRLLLPYLALGLLLSPLRFAEPWKWVFLLPQLTFYGFAAADMLIPKACFLRRFTAPARALTSLLLAAACAVVVLWTPPRSLWVETRA